MSFGVILFTLALRDEGFNSRNPGLYVSFLPVVLSVYLLTRKVDYMVEKKGFLFMRVSPFKVIKINSDNIIFVDQSRFYDASDGISYGKSFIIEIDKMVLRYDEIKDSLPINALKINDGFVTMLEYEATFCSVKISKN